MNKIRLKLLSLKTRLELLRAMRKAGMIEEKIKKEIRKEEAEKFGNS